MGKLANARSRSLFILALAAAAGMTDPLAAQEVVYRLPETVVTSSRVEQPAAELGSTMSVITGEELARRQIRLVSDALRGMPAVTVNRTGPVGGFTQLHIRGAEGNHTLVLIDGIEVNNPAGGSEFDFANLLEAEIERIEVLKGPQSALYGSDAIGGVVNIITRTPGRGFSYGGRAEAGSFATRNATAHAGFGGERFYLSGVVAGYTTSGVSVAEARNGNGEADGYDNLTGRIKFGFQPFDGLEIDGMGMAVDGWHDGDASAAMLGAIDSDDTSRSRQRYGQLGARLSTFGGVWRHSLRVSSVTDDTDFYSGGVRSFVNDGARDKIAYQSTATAATPDFADARHGLTVAVERERESQLTDSAFTGPVERAIVGYGYAGEYRVALWDTLFLTGGVRYDDNDPLFEDETTYRATAAWLLSAGTRLHASFGTGVKNPTLFQLFGATPTFTGNPGLSAERATGWDIGVEQPVWSGRAVVDVTYFRSNVDDLIEGSGNTAVNLPGTSLIQGIEVSVGVEPLAGLRVDAGYTFTDAQSADGSQLVRRPRHAATVNASYRFAWLERPASVHGGFHYNGARKDTVFENFFPLATRTATLGSYTLVDIGGRWEVRPGMELFVRAENVFDQQYQEVYGYGTPGAAAFAGVKLRMGP